MYEASLGGDSGGAQQAFDVTPATRHARLSQIKAMQSSVRRFLAVDAEYFPRSQKLFNSKYRQNSEKRNQRSMRKYWLGFRET